MAKTQQAATVALPIRNAIEIVSTPGGYVRVDRLQIQGDKVISHEEGQSDLPDIIISNLSREIIHRMLTGG
jgi:hypothetical protein